MDPTLRSHPTIALALTCLLVGCARSDPAGDAEAVTRTAVGDTTVVRTAGPGLWGDSVRLVEDLAIGTLDGAEEYRFGRVSDMAVDAEGGIYVFDSQGPVLRYYDRDGTFVRNVGREGQGPGEYGNASLGMAVRRSDGRLVMRDARNQRINVYEPDGSPSDTWRLESGLFTSQATALDDRDHAYLKIMTGPAERNQPWPVGLLRMDPEGRILDTIAPPALPDEPTGTGGTFGVSKVWTVGRTGGFIAAVNDRYVIDHYRPAGTVLRIERDVQPAAVGAEEQAEHEARNDWMWERQGQYMTSEIPPVPDVKPLFRSLYVGQEGRLWVHRYVAAEKREDLDAASGPSGDDAPPPLTWREPIVFDVFERDGAFLGTVHVPPRTSLRVFRGDTVWGVRLGDFDEPYVVRLRVEPVR